MLVSRISSLLVLIFFLAFVNNKTSRKCHQPHPADFLKTATREQNLHTDKQNNLLQVLDAYLSDLVLIVTSLQLCSGVM